MKRIIAVLLIMTAGMAAFASGSQEVNDDGVVVLEPRSLDRDSYFGDLERVELKGVIKYESPMAELSVGGKDYTLMTPGMHGYYGSISEGETIVVTGYLLEEDQYPYGPRGGMMYGGGAFCTDIDALEGNSVIMVETVEIDGTVYQLPWADDDFGYGNRGPRGGRMPGGMGSRGFNGPGRFSN